MSFSTLSVNQNNIVSNLSKYVTGATLNQVSEASAIVPGVALMGAIEGGIWAWKNRKDYRGGYERLKQDANARNTFIKSYNKFNPKEKFASLRNRWAGACEYIARKDFEACIEKLKRKYNSPEINRIIENLKNPAMVKSGFSTKDLLKFLEQIEAQANLEKYKLKVANQRNSGSLLRKFKDKIGITKLSTSNKELAVKSAKFLGLVKSLKANAGFAGISLGLGLLLDVIPSFGLGAGKGFKQLGKTTFKTGCEVSGWVAGMSLGTKAGAIAGTYIGGPLGTVIGGAIGLIGGFLGSMLFSKAADVIVGPNEIEKAKIKNAEEISRQSMVNYAALDELAQTAYLQLAAHAASGNWTVDDETAKQSLEALIGQEIDIDAAAEQYRQMVLEKEKSQPAQEYLAQNSRQTSNPSSQQSAQNQQTFGSASIPQYQQQTSYNPYSSDSNYTAYNYFNPAYSDSQSPTGINYYQMIYNNPFAQYNGNN